MKNPLVSILIPFKNNAKFLKDCLDSVCRQTYKNWEVLAVNDHSSDTSRSLVESLYEK
ncbi:glycosyltransferase family 2 protein, partial [Pricia sp.]|uniref:glycosyltransferase family 2 protein n=1 Tax=Pricia sp. TaxID=2268138 RepID=UPI0035940F67